MKIMPILIAALGTSLPIIIQAEPDTSGSWNVALEECRIGLPKSVEAVTEIVPGPTTDSKTLKVQIGEGQMASWEGKLTFKFPISSPGTYLLTFRAKTDPVDQAVELSVWKPTSGRSKRITDRKKENVGTEWTEIHYVFTVEEPEENLSFSCLGLARPASTWFFADFKLVKE